MNLKEIVEKINLGVVTGEDLLDREVEGVYISDLLSDVMGKAPADNLWLTIQGHSNITAVALLKDLAAVVLTGGNEYDSAAVEKSKEEDVILLATDLTSYGLACELCKLGI